MGKGEGRKVGRLYVHEVLPEGFVIRFWDATGRQVHDGVFRTMREATMVARFLEAGLKAADGMADVAHRRIGCPAPKPCDACIDERAEAAREAQDDRIAQRREEEE